MLELILAAAPAEVGAGNERHVEQLRVRQINTVHKQLIAILSKLVRFMTYSLTSQLPPLKLADWTSGAPKWIRQAAPCSTVILFKNKRAQEINMAVLGIN